MLLLRNDTGKKVTVSYSLVAVGAAGVRERSISKSQASKFKYFKESKHTKLFYTTLNKYNRLSLSRSRRDPLNHFEIFVLRHIRFSELRKISIEQPNFTNEHVI